MSLKINIIRDSYATDGQKVDTGYLLQEKQKVQSKFETVYRQCQEQQAALNNFKELLKGRVEEVEKQPRKVNEYAEYQQHLRKLGVFRNELSQVDSYCIELQSLIKKNKSFMGEHWKEDVRAISALTSRINPFYSTMYDQCSECNRLLNIFSRCSGMVKRRQKTFLTPPPFLITHFPAESSFSMGSCSSSSMLTSPTLALTPVLTDLDYIDEKGLYSSSETRLPSEENSEDLSVQNLDIRKKRDKSCFECLLSLFDCYMR